MTAALELCVEATDVAREAGNAEVQEARRGAPPIRVADRAAVPARIEDLDRLPGDACVGQHRHAVAGHDEAIGQREVGPVRVVGVVGRPRRRSRPGRRSPRGGPRRRRCGVRALVVTSSEPPAARAMALTLRARAATPPGIEREELAAAADQHCRSTDAAGARAAGRWWRRAARRSGCHAVQREQVADQHRRRRRSGTAASRSRDRRRRRRARVGPDGRASSCRLRVPSDPTRDRLAPASRESTRSGHGGASGLDRPAMQPSSVASKSRLVVSSERRYVIRLISKRQPSRSASASSWALSPARCPAGPRPWDRARIPPRPASSRCRRS